MTTEMLVVAVIIAAERSLVYVQQNIHVTAIIKQARQPAAKLTTPFIIIDLHVGFRYGAAEIQMPGTVVIIDTGGFDA